MDSREGKKEYINYQGSDRILIEKSMLIKEFTYALDYYSYFADQKKFGEHRSYVYALCEKVGNSLIPFYIGEGKGPRLWQHELEASEQIKRIKEELPKDSTATDFELRKLELSEKIKKIHEIEERNGIIVKYIIKWGMTSEEAFIAESALINLLRIGGLKFDSSCSEKRDTLTNKINGHQSKVEKKAGLTLAMTVEDFCKKYAKEPLYFEELQSKEVKAVLININAGYQECLNYQDENKKQKAIRDTACGNWKMRDITELEKLGIEYVFATHQARVVGIFKIKKVDGKKFHHMYESVRENSEYPHGDGTVSFRKGDYKLAELVVEAANKKGIDPSEVELDDMPSSYRLQFMENNKKIKESMRTPADVFKELLKRKYMILEDMTEDDPNYAEFSDFLDRMIVHAPDKEKNSIYGKGNPIRYIEGKIKNKFS